MAVIKTKTLRSKEHDPNESAPDAGDLCSVNPKLLADCVSTSSIISNISKSLWLVWAKHVACSTGALSANQWSQIIERRHRGHMRLFFFPAVPGRPTGVTLLEAVKDYMVLGWTPPANDGGADVRGYFVDYRTVKGDVVGKWHEMNHQALTTTTYRVIYLSLDYK